MTHGLEGKKADSIQGEILIYQPGVSESLLYNETFDCRLPVILTAYVHDPSWYFKNWYMVYNWVIDDETPVRDNATIIRTFSKGGQHRLKVNVIAFNATREELDRQPLLETAQIYGEFTQNITFGEPIGELHAEGKLLI